MTLRDLPPVRALAEERACNRFAIETAIAQEQTPGRWPAFDEINPDTCAWLIYIEVRILADLTRPDSRDAVARLVAAKVGIECGATAPTFCRMDRAAIRTSDPETPAFWAMWSGYSGEAQWHDLDDWPERPHRCRLSGIGAITDPAEALARVAIAVLA